MFSDFEIYIDYLTKSKLFEGLSTDEIEKFLNATDYKVMKFKANEDVAIDIDKSVFILDGSIATYDNRPDGTRSFINTFEPNGNNLVPITTRRPYPYENFCIMARKNSIVLYFDTMALMKPLIGVLYIQNIIQQNVIKMFYTMTECIVERTFINTSSYASVRVKKYIALLLAKQRTNPVIIPLKRNELANHLNMDISTINREFNKLIKLNYISVSGKKVTVLNEEKIREVFEGEEPDGTD